MKNLKLYYGFYDFANTTYLLALQNYLLPTYFSLVLINHGLTLWSWGLANGISTFVGVILWIILWKISDNKWINYKLHIFSLLIFISFITLLYLGYAIYTNPKEVFFIYIVSNSIVISSLSIYNSLITQVTTKDTIHEFSWFAWWFWYVGGIIWLISILILQKFLWDFSPFIFIFVAIFYLLFSCVSLFWILKYFKTKWVQEEKREVIKSDVSNKSKIKLLFWYWLISECITVIFLFFWTFVTWELKLSATIAWVCMLVVQLIWFPATVYGSKYFQKVWELKSMNIMVGVWFIAILSLISSIWIIGLILTIILWWLVIWNSQSLMRSEYGKLINSDKSWFEFGIFWFITQIWAFLWPILYGFMSDAIWSQKIPLLIFWLLMIVWVIILNFSWVYKKS